MPFLFLVPPSLGSRDILPVSSTLVPPSLGIQRHTTRVLQPCPSTPWDQWTYSPPRLWSQSVDIYRCNANTTWPQVRMSYQPERQMLRDLARHHLTRHTRLSEALTAGPCEAHASQCTCHCIHSDLTRSPCYTHSY